MLNSNIILSIITVFVIILTIVVLVIIKIRKKNKNDENKKEKFNLSDMKKNTKDLTKYNKCVKLYEECEKSSWMYYRQKKDKNKGYCRKYILYPCMNDVSRNKKPDCNKLITRKNLNRGIRGYSRYNKENKQWKEKCNKLIK
jgi:c-di-AMP phosphodiesterase-like protein